MAETSLWPSLFICFQQLPPAPVSEFTEGQRCLNRVWSWAIRKRPRYERGESPNGRRSSTRSTRSRDLGVPSLDLTTQRRRQHFGRAVGAHDHGEGDSRSTVTRLGREPLEAPLWNLIGNGHQPHHFMTVLTSEVLFVATHGASRVVERMIGLLQVSCVAGTCFFGPSQPRYLLIALENQSLHSVSYPFSLQPL